MILSWLGAITGRASERTGGICSPARPLFLPGWLLIWFNCNAMFWFMIVIIMLDTLHLTLRWNTPSVLSNVYHSLVYFLIKNDKYYLGTEWVVVGVLRAYLKWPSNNFSGCTICECFLLGQHIICHGQEYLYKYRHSGPWWWCRISQRTGSKQKQQLSR
jgi:hypothetical protein